MYSRLNLIQSSHTLMNKSIHASTVVKKSEKEREREEEEGGGTNPLAEPFSR